MNIKVSVKDLLESGAHFGHRRGRWNPKMKPYIFEERGGIYIIDLAKTLQQIREAAEVVQDVVSQRKSILFVGTKNQAQETIKTSANLCGEFYVDIRWLGGTLTNLITIRQSVKTLERIEQRIAAGEEGLTKKERSELTKKQMKLERYLAGIRGMRKPPGLLVVVDPYHEHLAVAEANKLGIPVMALIDTNCNPDPIDYVIACNDDSLKSIKLILGEITLAIAEKKKELKVAVVKEEEETLTQPIDVFLEESEPEKEET